jgi:hypothetical protein
VTVLPAAITQAGDHRNFVSECRFREECEQILHDHRSSANNFNGDTSQPASPRPFVSNSAIGLRRAEPQGSDSHGSIDSRMAKLLAHPALIA